MAYDRESPNFSWSGRAGLRAPLTVTLGAQDSLMRTFERGNASDVLEALHRNAAAFAKDPLNTDLANHCAIDAWSLCDWVFKEHGKRLGFTSLANLQATMKANCNSLQLLQDVANASKHKEITRYTPQLKEAKKHKGGFQRGAFSRDFDVSALVLVREDGSEIWFDDALDEATRYWDTYFSANGLN